MISSIITWSGFGVTIGAILHILNPILGFIGACLWVGHGFYKFKKERNEFKQSEIKLKNLQDKAEKKHH